MPTSLVIPPPTSQPSGSPTHPPTRSPLGVAAPGRTNAPPPSSADVVVVRAVRTDEARLRFRLRQIELGKSSSEYLAYVAAVPKDAREAGNVSHPVTPRAEGVCSKRTFDAYMKTWRRSLHAHWEVAGGGSSTVSRSSSAEGEGEEKNEKPKKLWTEFKGSWASECDEDPDFRDFDDEEF